MPVDDRCGDVAAWAERLTHISAEMMDVKQIVIVLVSLPS